MQVGDGQLPRQTCLNCVAIGSTREERLEPRTQCVFFPFGLVGQRFEQKATKETKKAFGWQRTAGPSVPSNAESHADAPSAAASVPVLRVSRSMAPIPPAASPCTRSASSYWMLSADIIGRSCSGPGRFSIRRKILRLRCRSMLTTVDFTRKPLLIGVVRSCSYLYYSKNTEAFRAFSAIQPSEFQKTRLVQD